MPEEGFNGDIQDGQLVARVVVKGDPGAARALFAKYQRFVYSILLSKGIGRDDADDLFQEFFARLASDDYRPLRSWHGGGRLKSYLAAILQNMIVDFFRTRRGEAGLGDLGHEHAQADPAPGPYELVCADELRRTLHSAVCQLPDRDRELVIRVHYQGQSYKEVAEAMRMTVTNVGVALYRAHRRLKEAVGSVYATSFLDEEPAPLVPGSQSADSTTDDTADE
jgi:RNA polymerase sigma-70 factor, ECF subfamily